MTMAVVDPVAVAGLGWTILVGIIGGIVGGITTGVAIGIWVGRLAGRVDKLEEAVKDMADRLKAGDTRFDELVRLGEKAQVVSREIDGLSRTIGNVQTKDLCAERHRLGIEIGEHAGRLVASLDRLASSIDRAKGFGLASRQED